MIQMTNIMKRFGDKTVLSDVNFHVEGGEIFGLIGPSGSGKTTIINILTGQFPPDSGKYQVGATSKQIGLMLEEDGLYSRLTTAENLNLFAGIYGVPKSKVQRALRNVGLGNDLKTPVAKLSKGMRQRLVLARAILHDPKILFLDEPTSALDPGTARGIHKLILSLRDQGATIFLTTHNMEEAVDLCDHVALLHQGKIVEHGSPKAICEKHNSYKTVPDLGSVFLKMTGVTVE
ncbi:MAG: ABC transporter ATP-binding protein [Oscillospiraceae bacterium]|nr:ABC transporter ATP-binding protein [Oscillospiraceae bacterium]